MKKILYIILVLAIIGVTSVIFYNSSEDYTTSFNKSEEVAEIIRPSSVENVERANFIIRKGAHLVEFGTLGLFVMLLALTIKHNTNRSFVGYSYFYVLAVAVTDEHIQSFSNRTSCTDDIIIDFVGALMGIILATILFFVFKLIRHKKTV